MLTSRQKQLWPARVRRLHFPPFHQSRHGNWRCSTWSCEHAPDSDESSVSHRALGIGFLRSRQARSDRRRKRDTKQARCTVLRVPSALRRRDDTGSSKLSCDSRCDIEVGEVAPVALKGIASTRNNFGQSFHRVLTPVRPSTAQHMVLLGHFPRPCSLRSSSRARYDL